MTVNEQVRDTYRALRTEAQRQWIVCQGWSNTVPAAAVLVEARRLVADGKPLHYYGTSEGGAGAPFKIGHDEVRWYENYEAVGFRHVGKAHDLAPRAVEHTGWYRDAFANETIAGSVFLLPGRHGKAQVYTGYLDPDNDGAACITTHRYEALEVEDRWEAEDNRRYHDAACDADGIAKRAAEDEREHDQAWQAGARWAENREELRAIRQERRRLAHAARDNVRHNPIICEGLRKLIAQGREAARGLHEENEKLAAGEWYRNDFDLTFSTRDKGMVATFCDGAGIPVEEFPA